MRQPDGSLLFSDWSDPFTAVQPADNSIQVGSDIDIGTGKILYSNVYPTLADLPDAASYHGMFAHVHAEGAAYYAHAGDWVRLADDADVPTAFVSGLNGLTGPVILAAGNNVQIGQSGNQLTISSTQTFTTLNGESGTLSLVGDSGVSVSTVDGTITVSGAGLATEGFVNQAVADLVNSAPQTLDTLAELANALNNDSDFAANVTTLISQKADANHTHVKANITDLTTGDLDMQGNRVLFANYYATQGDFPDPAVYHGMVAHSHADGAFYGAHAGQWVRLANQNEIPAATSVNTLTGNVTLVAGDNINVTTSGQNVVISGEQGGIVWSTPPQNGSSPGSPGDIAYDDNFLYLRTSQAWRQVALSPISTNITISQQPSNQSVDDGDTATFTVLATAGGETITYQWGQSADNGSTFVDVSGATSNSLTVAANLTLDGYQYRASLAASGAADVTTSVATLTVSDTFDLRTESGDRLLTEGGLEINHDGVAGGSGGGGNDPGPEPSGDWELFGASIAGDAAALDADGDTLLVTDASNASFIKRVDGGWGSPYVISLAAFDFNDPAGKADLSLDGNTAVKAGTPYQSNHNGWTFFDIIRREFSGGQWITPQNGSISVSFDSISGYSGFVRRVTASRTGNHIAVVFRSYYGGDFEAKFFNVSSGDWVEDTAAFRGNFGLGIGGRIYDNHISDDGGVFSSLLFDVGNNIPATSYKVRRWQWTGTAWAESPYFEVAPNGDSVSSGAFSGDGLRVAVGDHLAASGGTERGVAKVYEFANNAWSQVGGDITGTDDYDHLGYSVSLNDDGTVLAVGVRGEDAGGLNSGLVRIYQWNGASWAPVSGDISGTSSNEYLGNSVAISGDGKTVAAGGDVNVLTYELQNNQITITQQPQNVTYVGSPVVFSANATVSDNSSPSYLWQSSADNGSTWANLSGETASNLTVSNITPSDDGSQYRAVISAARAPDATTDNATLTVNENVLFSQQPQNTTVVAGNDATFSATLTPADNWYVYDMKWERADSGSPNSWNVVETEDIANYVISNSSAVTQNYTWPSASSFDDGDLFRATGAAFENELIQTSPTPAGVVIPQQGEVAWLFGLISVLSAYWSAAVNGTLVVTCQSRTYPSGYLWVNLYINGISVGSFQGHGPVSSSAFQVSSGDQIEVAVTAGGVSWYPRISLQFTPTGGLQTQNVTSATATLTVT